MSLGAINSINFQGNISRHIRTADQQPEAYENYIQKAEKKAQQDVHLSTIVASVGIITAAIVKGKNLISLATKAVATTGELVTKTAVKAACGTINLIKSKKGEPINPEKALKKITNFADTLRNENPKTCEKFIKGTEDFIGKIFGEERGKAVSNFLVKNGMDNTIGLAQGVAAGIIGAGIADNAADRIEGAIDNNNISKAKKTQEAMDAIESIEAVISAIS